MTTEQQKMGALIRAKRKEKKITLAELGELLGVGQMAISHYEKGDIKVIPYERRVKLSSLLNIPLDFLLYENEKSKELTPRDKLIFDILNTSKNKNEMKRKLGDLYSDLNVSSSTKAEIIDIIVSVYENNKYSEELGLNLERKSNIKKLNDIIFNMSNLNDYIKIGKHLLKAGDDQNTKK